MLTSRSLFTLFLVSSISPFYETHNLDKPIIDLCAVINFTHVLCAGTTSGRSHTMSGILKRKLEEGPSPYLSLQGSDDDEVSCSDSGNSSDSLNHPVPSGLLDCKIT